MKVSPYNTWIKGTMQDLIKSDFYSTIRYEKSGKIFLEYLKKGHAKAIIGANAGASLILEAKKTGNKIEYRGFDVNKIHTEITDCIPIML